MRKSAGLFRDMSEFAAIVQRAFERGGDASSLLLSFGEFGFDAVVQAWVDAGAIEIEATDDFAGEIEVTWLQPALAARFGMLGDDPDTLIDADPRIYADVA